MEDKNRLWLILVAILPALTGMGVTLYSVVQQREPVYTPLIVGSVVTVFIINSFSLNRPTK